MPKFDEKPEERKPILKKDQVEIAYNSDIDYQRSLQRTLRLEQDAQRVVMRFFNAYFGDAMTVRPVSSVGDGVSMTTATGHDMRAVGFNDRGVPIMGIEIILTQKDMEAAVKQLKRHPTVRLNETSIYSDPLPKVLIKLDPQEVEVLAKDYDFSKYPKIEAKILKHVIISLEFAFINAKDEEGERNIRKMINLFEGKAKKGKSH